MRTLANLLRPLLWITMKEQVEAMPRYSHFFVIGEADEINEHLVTRYRGSVDPARVKEENNVKQQNTRMGNGGGEGDVSEELRVLRLNECKEVHGRLEELARVM